MANPFGFIPPASNALVFNINTDDVYTPPSFFSTLQAIQMLDGVIETAFFDSVSVDDSLIRFSNSYKMTLADSFSISEYGQVSPLMKFLESLSITDDANVGGLFNVLFQDNLSLTEDAIVKSRLLLAMTEEISFTDDARLNGLIIQRLFDKLNITDYLSETKTEDADDPDLHDTFFMNFKLQAFTRYKGLSFTSATKFKGKYLLTNDRGIYSNIGATDDIRPISSSFKTGLIRFGGSMKSRIDKVFLATKNDGDMRIKLIGSDGVEQIYKLTQSSTTIKEKSVQFGKGDGNGGARKCTYFQFEIDNDGSTNFELDNFSVYKLVTSTKT